MAENAQTTLEFDPALQWRGMLASSKDRLVLLPRNPSSILAYWEWTSKKAGLFASGVLAPEISIKLFCTKNGEQKAEIKTRWDTLKLYVQAPAPGCYYKGSLSYFTADGKPQSSLDSNTVQIPAGATSADADFLPSSEERLRRS